MQNRKDRFEFGKNWHDFITKQFSYERLESARAKMLAALQRDSLEGMSFLDIGCGSGLHSLAALQAGAERVFSFDYDIDSVTTSKLLKRQYATDSNWQIIQGSVLDQTFVSSLGKFDIVYSWGVLHHTGNMWEAIRNTGDSVDSNGVLFIALYSHTIYQNGQLGGAPSPQQWLAIKQEYNSAGLIKKRFMEYKYVWNTFLKPPRFAPWKVFENYSKFKECCREYMHSRGMEMWTDVRDWLGGWPMEFVNELDLQRFARDQLDMRLVEMYGGEGNTEFILVPQKARNWWSSKFQDKQRLLLNGPFERLDGNCWIASVPQLASLSDNNLAGVKSAVRLWENDIMLTLAHCSLETIKIYGRGRYSHWGQDILFSTTDNTDPNDNGKHYYAIY